MVRGPSTSSPTVQQTPWNSILVCPVTSLQCWSLQLSLQATDVSVEQQTVLVQIPGAQPRGYPITLVGKLVRELIALGSPISFVKLSLAAWLCLLKWNKKMTGLLPPSGKARSLKLTASRLTGLRRGQGDL